MRDEYKKRSLRVVCEFGGVVKILRKRNFY